MELDGSSPALLKCVEEVQVGQDLFLAGRRWRPQTHLNRRQRYRAAEFHRLSRRLVEHELLACEKEVLGFIYPVIPRALFRQN